jgi:hypothetical protein
MRAEPRQVCNRNRAARVGAGAWPGRACIESGSLPPPGGNVRCGVALRSVFWIRMLRAGTRGRAAAVFITQVDRLPKPREPVNYDGVMRIVETVVQPGNSGQDADVHVSALSE